jgi:hypothetical protein
VVGKTKLEHEFGESRWGYTASACFMFATERERERVTNEANEAVDSSRIPEAERIQVDGQKCLSFQENFAAEKEVTTTLTL